MACACRVVNASLEYIAAELGFAGSSVLQGNHPELASNFLLCLAVSLKHSKWTISLPHQWTRWVRFYAIFKASGVTFQKMYSFLHWPVMMPEHLNSALYMGWLFTEVTCAALPELVWMRMGSFARIMVNGIFYVSFLLAMSLEC